MIAGAVFKRIDTQLIDVPDRLRPPKPWRVEALAAELGDQQPQHPINVEEADAGRYTLISGATRLASVILAGHSGIDAKVYPQGSLTAHQRRLMEITENLNREPLTKLERAEHLAEFKRVHEAENPESRRGGDRRSARAKAARSDQSEILAFSSEAAEMTGLSRRAIEVAVAIVTGLTDASKARARGTWLEDHQAGLKLLSTQDAEMQARVCDLLLSDPPAASSVAEAIVLASGGRLPTAADKLFKSTMGNWARLSSRQRADFLDANEAAIRDHATERGWL